MRHPGPVPAFAPCLLAALLAGSLAAPASAISLGQRSDFEDATTQGWRSGPGNPTPPSLVMDGGPDGPGDAFLRVESNGPGGTQAGSRLVTFNTEPMWRGNYNTSGVTAIEAWVNNLGDVDLVLRLGIRGAVGAARRNRNASSTRGVALAPGSGWTRARFSLALEDLTPIESDVTVQAVLRRVQELRILHSPEPARSGEALVASLGVDDVAAVPEPSTALLVGAGLAALARRRRRPAEPAPGARRAGQ